MPAASVRPADPERLIAIAHAPVAARPALNALFALDERLAGILRTTTQSLIGQMRLTWWHEALGTIDAAPPPAEPVLIALAGAGMTGAAGLQQIVEGWEALLEEPLSEDAILAHAEARGGTMFALAAEACDVPGSDAVRAAGRGWALADLARHLSDADLARLALARAGEALDAAPRRWPAPARALGMLARLARIDARGGPLSPPASRGRIAVMLWHRLTGRA